MTRYSEEHVHRQQDRRGHQQRDRGPERDVVGEVGREVDPAGDDQRQRGHPELRDGRERALVHPDASLVMITSVATCIAPRMPAE